jgi:hypothetical protein
MKSIHNYILILSIACLSFQGCKKYLDIAPKSSVAEEEMFASEIGFRQTLNGVYSTIASRNLYGDNLSMGFVSALAQNYNTSGASGLFVKSRNYDYESAEVIGYTGQVWSKAYNGIAGLNNILKFCEQNRSVLTDEAYTEIKGEALGLRGFLHFELLRMFAPSFIVSPQAKAIPYRVTIDQYSQVPATVTEVTELALQDLLQSADLLKKVDPILTGSTERRYKFNYYAAKGVLARIYLYRGDQARAYSTAKEIVDSGLFPFVDKSSVSAAAGTKDRLFKSELVFAVRNRNIQTWAYDQYFTFYGSFSNRLSRPEADFKTLYEVSTVGEGDIRWLNLFEDNQGFKFPSKFWQTSSTSIDSLRLDHMIPVIRCSEMRYIMAETATSAEEALNQLNQVRLARTVPALPATVGNLDRTFIQNEITKEYQKEMYAEGQLFYYYKRRNFTDIPFKPAGMTSFSTKNYLLPIPKDELEFNPNY